jgi:uncharacterized protein (DUF433 family)
MIPGMFGGKPTIRGMRFRVCDVMSYLASGETRETILEDFEFLEDEDITAALAFANDVTENIRIGAQTTIDEELSIPRITIKGNVKVE